MSENQPDRFNEELLDRALEHYRAAGPRPGLEERILAQLDSSSTATPAWRWWELATPQAGLAVAAALLVATAVFYFASRPAPPAPAERAREQAPVETPATEARQEPSQVASTVLPAAPPETRTRKSAASRPVRRIPREPVETAVAAAPPPRLPTFPSVRPLSEQERLLLGLVESAGTDGPLRLLLASGKPKSLEASRLSIPLLDIRPLGGRDTAFEEQGEGGK